LLWVVGLVALAAISALSRPRVPGPLAKPGFADTYYVDAHLHFALSIGAAFAIFSVVYFGLETAGRGRRRPLLGGIHFALSFVGALLIFLPMVLLSAINSPLASSVGAAFRTLNGVASVGYLMTLSGLAVFLVVLADSFRRAPNLR
jgi:cytochrome c oxidase subunit 1